MVRTYSDDEYADALEGERRPGGLEQIRKFLDKLNAGHGGALGELVYDAPARAPHRNHVHTAVYVDGKPSATGGHIGPKK